jgi:hypothetical protein
MYIHAANWEVLLPLAISINALILIAGLFMVFRGRVLQWAVVKRHAWARVPVTIFVVALPTLLATAECLDLARQYTRGVFVSTDTGGRTVYVRPPAGGDIWAT